MMYIMYTKTIMGNIMIEDVIFNYNVDDRFIHYFSFRKETRDRKMNFRVDRKEACKNQTQAGVIYIA